MNPIEAIKPYLKSIVGFVTPGIVALVAAVQDSSPAKDHITTAEWVGIIAACFITAGAVFAVPNLPRTNEPRGPDSVSAGAAEEDLPPE
jgi:hypothetical protein